MQSTMKSYIEDRQLEFSLIAWHDSVPMALFSDFY